VTAAGFVVTVAAGSLGGNPYIEGDDMNPVTTSRAARTVRRAIGGVAIFASFLLPVESAHAGATVLRLTFTNTETFTFEFPWCIPGNPTADATRTETTTLQIVENRNVFTVHGVNEFDERFVLENGMYVQSGRRDSSNFVFVLNPPLTVSHVADRFFATIYAADDTPVGRLMIHAGSHITFRDVNDNGIPEEGEISVEFDNFRFRCL
jgi:hypothetical protein